MKYIKTFETHSEYEAFTATTEFVRPNLSVCKDNNETHYNPWVETRLVATYTVGDESEDTLIYNYDNIGSGEEIFSKIEIDGVEVSIEDIDENSGYYSLTEGVHNVYYTLITTTAIGRQAFQGCSRLTSIDIPNSVTRIVSQTFQDCSGLTSINIPNSVTTIGDSAFFNCTSLTSRTIGSSVTSIGISAFYNCTSLTRINIPTGVTSIGDAAFYRCSGLTSIDIPNSVTRIGRDVFFGCSSITSVTIGSGVTSIGGYALQNCSGLTSITSNSTTAPTIASNAFKGINTNGTLYVPIGSSGYDVWMGTGNYYLGYYNWTKVEQ